MTTDLKSTCLRFKQHCDECKKCRVLVNANTNLFKIGFYMDQQPHLCTEGKSILLEIFE